jgi:hypothetical protein
MRARLLPVIAEEQTMHDVAFKPELDQRATVRTVVRTLRWRRDEANALQTLYRKEARKLPGWKPLNRTDKHVARHLARLMTSPHSGEVFTNAQKLCTLIPPAPTQRRPNTSGHISRTTLWSSLKRLEAAGIFTSWKTLGKRIAVSDWRTAWGRNGRTPAIRVWRLNRDAWARAWATLKYAVRQGNLNTVRAATCPSDERGRSRQSRAPFWADNQPSRSPSRHSSRFRKWVEASTPVEAIEKLWGHEEALEFGAYLVARAA